MKIKQLLLAAAAMVFAVACNETPDPVVPGPEPTPTPDTWSVVGTNNNWDAAGAAAMEFADGYYSAKGVEFGENGEFKFVKDNAWTVSRSYTGEKPVRANYYYAVAQADGEGTNIKLEAAGTYDIYLNEAADTFYLMEAGKAPAEAADAETIVVEPACAATAIISDEYVEEVGTYEVTYTFKVTTKDAVKAAYLYKKSDLVDETFTAEYIFTDGNELYEGDDELSGLNKENFEVMIWADFETEYTLFLAVKDADGLTKMVTKTFTAPEGPTVYQDWDASAVADLDTELEYSTVVFTTSEYQVRVSICGLIENNMEYSMLDPEYPANVYIESALLMDLAGENIISRLSTGTLGIYDSMMMGSYTEFRGSGVDADGKAVVVELNCSGALEGLGGGAGTMQFVVASAKFYHSNNNDWDVPADDRRYILEANSTEGLQAVLVIDNYYPLATFVDGTPYLQGWMQPDVDEAPYLNLEYSFITMHMITGYTYIGVDTGMPGQDMNLIQGMLTAVSYMGDGTPTEVVISCPMPIAMYTEGGGGATADYNPEVWGNTTFDHNCNNNNVVSLTSFGNSGNLIINLATEDGTFASADGIYYSVDNGDLSGYYYDYMSDGEYYFVEGGFTVAVVDGKYTLTVGEEGCYMQDDNATLRYSIVPGTYDITINM